MCREIGESNGRGKEGGGMNYKIENAVQEAIQEAIEKQLSAIKYNIANAVQGLLYSAQLENEKQGGVCDINTLVNIIVSSTKYDGPEGEEYPVWNQDNPISKAIIKRLETVLQSHGIEQSWNIGRKKGIT